MDDANISISVVIPTYNRAHTIARAIESILHQTVPVDEIIVVDDGSEDQIDAVMQTYLFPPRKHPVVMFNKISHGGAQRARNHGIRMASSDYVCFLDSDDYYLPNYIETVRPYICQHPNSVITNTCFVIKNGNLVKWNTNGGNGNVYRDLLSRQWPFFQGLLAKKECFATIGYLDENIKSYQEWETSIRLAKHYPFVFIDEGLFVYTQNIEENAISTSINANAGYEQIVKKHRKEILNYCGYHILEYHYSRMSKMYPGEKGAKYLTRAKQCHLLHLRSLQRTNNHDSAIPMPQPKTPLKNANMTNTEKLMAVVRDNYNASQELIYAHVFHDTIKGSAWLSPDTPFSPGRGAMGYPALYVLYRVLNEMRPKSILELGLGQSTRMISQYGLWKKECQHIVAEHDPQCIAFFKRSFPIPESTVITNLPLLEETVTLNSEICKVTVYAGFVERFQNIKFDFICVDGPCGSDSVSRIDIIKLLPQCLEETFVILLDDFNRQGEKNTAKVICGILQNNGIKHALGSYYGQVGVGVIVSENLKFLCSL